MEEDQVLQINVEGVLGDEFYEKIEAPKFVDFAAPDNYHPGDDRYWFCLRVGCDQKHEEEMDSEAIYKNFVLRVMAARSPNVRLQKALSRKNSSNVKCPQTVPAKSSRAKVSRLALVSSMSKRIGDPKVKVRSLSKQTATPNAKTKQSSVVAKALTTPGNKNRLSNPNAFQSVRNPKSTSIQLPKNRVVAKALVFHSPEKSRTNTSLELKTPVKTLCAGMKKLEITDQKKQVLGMSRPLSTNASRKLIRGRDVKSRFYDGLRTQNIKGQVTKPSESSKETRKNLHPVHHVGVEDDSSDMEIEEKSRNGSLVLCSTLKREKVSEHEAPSIVVVTNPIFGGNEVLSDGSSGYQNSLSHSEERSFVDNDTPKLLLSSTEVNETNERRRTEEKIESCSEKATYENGKNGNKENILISDVKENDGEVMESDDKENTSVSDVNRNLDLNAGGLERNIIGKHETPKTTQKITRAMSKPSKESSMPAPSGIQGPRQRKPKPTNPKPFRLRTDERRILKEANSEKKTHVAAPLKEVTSVVRFHAGNLQKKHLNAFQRKQKCIKQTEYGIVPYDSKAEGTNGTRRDKSQSETSRLKISKERVRHRTSTTPQRHTVSSQLKLVSPHQEQSQAKEARKLGNSFKKTKSPLSRQSTQPRENEPSTRDVSVITPGRQLGVIKEPSPTILGPKESAKPSDVGASLLTNKDSVVSRPSMQRKRFTTIPKEPNFHTIHTPKSCIRRAT